MLLEILSKKLHWHFFYGSFDNIRFEIRINIQFIEEKKKLYKIILQITLV